MKKQIYLAVKVSVGAALVYFAYVLYQMHRKNVEFHAAKERAAALERRGPPFHYDPLTCKTDAKGMLYVSHYERVFKIPFRGGLMIDPIYDKKVKAVQPIAPDLEEAVGCPNHPYAVSSVYYLYLYEAIKTNKFAPPIAPMSADLVKIVFITAGYEGGLDEEGKNYKRVCGHNSQYNKVIKRKFKNGIAGCLLEPLKNDIPERSWVKGYPERAWISAYQTDINIYSTPRGGVFSIYCRASPTCRVAYKIYPRLNLSYRFDRERRIPIERVIEFDKSLRKSIYDSEIKNYPWASQIENKQETDLTLPKRGLKND